MGAGEGASSVRAAEISVSWPFTTFPGEVEDTEVRDGLWLLSPLGDPEKGLLDRERK